MIGKARLCPECWLLTSGLEQEERKVFLQEVDIPPGGGGQEEQLLEAVQPSGSLTEQWCDP
jgi:hypothetical protein